MAANTRTKFERERDRQEIARLYLRGWIQQAIADHLGLSQQQISYDLGVIQRRWRNDTARNLDEDKARELARIDEMEREYWDAWRRSQEPQESSTTGRYTGDKASDRAQIRKVQRDGDPRFLAGVQWCVEQRCKLLGLYAPTKTALTDPTGTQEMDFGGIRQLLEHRFNRLLDEE